VSQTDSDFAVSSMSSNFKAIMAAYIAVTRDGMGLKTGGTRCLQRATIAIASQEGKPEGVGGS
jgi:hypothetical protein